MLQRGCNRLIYALIDATPCHEIPETANWFPPFSPIPFLLQLLQNLSLKSEAQAAEQYALHYLNLDYPLQVEANKSEYDPHPDTTITEEEFIKILDSLSIIHDLVNEKVLGIHPSLYRDIFSFIKEKINHNRNNVLNILGLDDSCVGIPEYAYNGKHNRIEYGVAKEALKILQVLRLKYEYMLTKMAED